MNQGHCFYPQVFYILLWIHQDYNYSKPVESTALFTLPYMGIGVLFKLSLFCLPWQLSQYINQDINIDHNDMGAHKVSAKFSNYIMFSMVIQPFNAFAFKWTFN